MATELVTQDLYYAAFHGLVSTRRDEPEWLREMRRRSFARFESEGFPTVKNEEWKYTNVSAIAKAKFSPVMTANGTSLSQTSSRFTYEETKKSVFVFVNGIFRGDLSTIEALPASVSGLGLDEALRDDAHQSLIRQSLEQDSIEEQNSFTLLNTALFAGGLFIKIPHGVEIETPIQLQFVSEAVNGETPAAAF